ncbi:FGGY-family carbohydrate kinase [Agromyces subbeticus]|uniref:FGGY-family carbohydrate kinase n=1 Tax=Agromyces subbeticus TaxID=293890 RepID=UPI0003B3955D|nr:FGGY-family carbohydrate kinase [Agromyces subbeticus]
MAVRAVLGVDIGTSSSKGVLVDLDGAVLRSAVREHEVQRPAPGHVEMDATVWWQEFVSLARELASPDVEVTAVGVSGMGPCVLVTDAEGTPVRRAILYGVDTRAGVQIAELEARLGAEAIAERGGATLSSQAAGPKLAWIAANEPDVAARASRLFMPASWLAFRLTGAYVLDHHSASQCWPLYDRAASAWYEPWWAEICPWLDAPELHWAGDRAGVVGTDVAEETGLPAGIPVITGTIDAWSEAVSVDGVHPGDLFLMYGTTMFLIDTVPEPVTSPTLWGTAGVEPGTHSLAGGMATSGAVTAWLRDLFGRPDYTTLVAEASAAPPGASGLVMLPYFAGERTPVQDPDARGAIVGLTIEHTRGDLYRAALEATAFAVRHNIETMRRDGGDIRRIIAAGGGTQSALWPQIVSDVTGLPQVLPRVTIGASYGAAYLAARTIADVSIARWNPPQSTIRPESGRAERYDELYRLYLELYPATRDTAHHLAALQRSSRSHA